MTVVVVVVVIVCIVVLVLSGMAILYWKTNRKLRQKPVEFDDLNLPSPLADAGRNIRIPENHYGIPAESSK